MADCPYCLQPGATRFLWRVRCANPMCPKYDESLGARPTSYASRPDTLTMRPGIERADVEEDVLPEVRREPTMGGEEERAQEDVGPAEAPPPAPIPNALPPAVPAWRRLLGVLLLAGGVGMIIGFPAGEEHVRSPRMGFLLLFLGWNLVKGAGRGGSPTGRR